MITAIGAGMGIATVQALMPAFIKRHFGANTGRMIGFYSSAIVGGAVIAAAFSAQLASTLGWTQALSLWGYIAIAGLALWWAINARIRDRNTHPATATTTHSPYWKHHRSWSLLLFFGLGTGAFMLILAWLPAFYVSLGKSPEFSGYLLASFTLIELITAFVISGVIHHYPDRRGPLLVSLTLVIGGLTCLLVSPLALAWVATALLGTGIGLLFPLSLIVTVDHIDDPQQAGDFSAFVTGGGYIIASVMPFLAGWIRDSFASLAYAWLLMATAMVILLLMAIQYSPASYARFGQKVTAH